MANPNESFVDEELRELFARDREAFRLEKNGSADTSEWAVKCEKDETRMPFREFAWRARLSPFKAHCLLAHQAPAPQDGEPVGGKTIYCRTIYEAARAESSDPDASENETDGAETIRRTVRGLSVADLQLIQKRLELSSHADAIRTAIEAMAHALRARGEKED